MFHGREWVSLPAVLNAINELTENYAANQALLDAVDFYFLPVVSPDSYAYSWSDVSTCSQLYIIMTISVSKWLLC